MNKKPKPVPSFASETEEREYWETHDSTEHLDWTKARQAVLPNLKPSTSPTEPREERWADSPAPNLAIDEITYKNNR